jgi:uncharacterized protein
MEVIKRFFKALGTSSSFFLFGPRGTGKSTWLKITYPESLWIDLLIHEQLLEYTAHPDLLRKIVYANPNKRTVVIDEVQKIPELLSVVHSLIEEKKERHFILTGSSTRKLKRAGVDLLAGRALLRTLHPFMAGELKQLFQIEKALQFGLLPIVWGSETPESTLKSYVALYLKEEVQAEGLVRNIGSFARFLEAISFSYASQLNVSNIARECHVERTVVESYIQILEDLLLSYRLPVFVKRAAREVTSHPKFYFFDVGVFRSLRPHALLDRSEEIEGHALEGLVMQHLKAWCEYSQDDTQIYFWRTRSGVEVDFIIYGSEGFWAIEVKNNTKVFSSDLKGLKAFTQDYPECTPILLYRGKNRLMEDNVLCLPCDEFLLALKPNQPLLV